MRKKQTMEKAGGRATCKFLEGASLDPILLLDIRSHCELASEKSSCVLLLFSLMQSEKVTKASCKSQVQ